MATPIEVRNALVVVAISLTASAILFRLLTLLRSTVWEPLRLRRIMAKQGVTGPPFSFLLGNLSEMNAYEKSFPEAMTLDDNFATLMPTVVPQDALYFPRYGKRFLYWVGPETRVVVRDPEIVKEVLSIKFEFFKRTPFEDYLGACILGKSLSYWFGKRWALERRIVNPFFHQESLKGMVETMVKGAAPEIQKWEQLVAQAGGLLELDVQTDIHNISCKIISFTAFGGDFETGKKVCDLQIEYCEVIFQAIQSPTFWMPGFWLLPTRENRRMAKLYSDISTVLYGLINSRRKAVQMGTTSSYGDDLLGRMLAAASDGVDDSAQEFNFASVFNDCKLFYLAGQDTVASSTCFIMLLLARYPEWQDRARREVFDVIGEKEEYDSSKLSHLKVVGMIINEGLRLFTGVPSLVRLATKDMQLGDLFVPKGLAVECAIGAIHQDPAYWGEDAASFNPERFANGASKACKPPHAFMPFSHGPKFCIGQNFALNEAKILLSMVLRRFQILPSPNYKHHPEMVIVQKPKYGMPIILKAL